MERIIDKGVTLLVWWLALVLLRETLWRFL